MAAKEWDGQLSDASLQISVVINHLRDLAEALEVVGNYRLANAIRRDVECLALAQTDLRKGQAGAVDAYVQQTNQASTNMVKAALAGAGIDPLIVGGHQGKTANPPQNPPSGGSGVTPPRA